MMYFGDELVPGATWVEIVSVREKDGSPIGHDNWRKELFGRITLCWIAGGLHMRGAFFRFALRMEKDQVKSVNVHTTTWCSTTRAQPIEVEPGIFDFTTHTSIYRLRVLSEEEAFAAFMAVNAAMRQEVEGYVEMVETDASDGIPAS